MSLTDKEYNLLKNDCKKDFVIVWIESVKVGEITYQKMFADSDYLYTFTRQAKELPFTLPPYSDIKVTDSKIFKWIIEFSKSNGIELNYGGWTADKQDFLVDVFIRPEDNTSELKALLHRLKLVSDDYHKASYTVVFSFAEKNIDEVMNLTKEIKK